jgi:protein-L-isoaspartate(D-aspartate) O-methyltransferase
VFKSDRSRLFDHLTKAMGDGPTLDAMRAVPRERFVPDRLRSQAYKNKPLPIGNRQTISQPQMVAWAADALQLAGDEYVLEVGAGSGYQAAVIAALLPEGKVVATERIPELVAMATVNLAKCGVGNVRVVQTGPGLGAPELGPFDAILVSASAPQVPEPLLSQLKPGGRMVIPVGVGQYQNLTRVRVEADGVKIEELGPCSYVPLLGEGAWQTLL